MLEFLPEGETVPKFVDEIEPGGVYTVVMTTDGGLYRYNLQDRVQVTGRFRGLPLLRFVGRCAVSDLVGEKLEATHVQRVVEQGFRRCRMGFAFAMLAPELAAYGGDYTLFAEPAAQMGAHGWTALRQAIEDGLGENYHYRYARACHQLSSLRVFRVEAHGVRSFLKRCTDEGQRLGDVKPTFLDRRVGWVPHFRGHLVA